MQIVQSFNLDEKMYMEKVKTPDKPKSPSGFLDSLVQSGYEVFCSNAALDGFPKTVMLKGDTKLDFKGDLNRIAETHNVPYGSSFFYTSHQADKKK